MRHQGTAGHCPEQLRGPAVPLPEPLPEPACLQAAAGRARGAVQLRAVAEHVQGQAGGLVPLLWLHRDVAAFFEPVPPLQCCRRGW